MKDKADKPIQYRLELINTADATGYFACRTNDISGLSAMIDYLRDAPLDEFMHNQVLRHLAEMAPADQTAFLQAALDDEDMLRLALCREAGLDTAAPVKLKKAFSMVPAKDMLPHTPLITLKSKNAKDRSLHAKWIDLFRENIHHHVPLKKETGLPPVFEPRLLARAYENETDIAAIWNKHKGAAPENSDLPSPEETAAKALDILNRLGILEGEEMRHEASLSPIALIRKWRMKVAVHSRRHHYELSGIQNSYGRGLALEAARASNLMEVLERYAAFAGCNADHIPGYENDYPLMYGTYAALHNSRTPVLYPNAMCLETPYEDDNLYWMRAEKHSSGGVEEIRVPVQAVFLFCNLDEPALFSGLGSTGLASGNTMAQAKVAALLEIMERDAEATTPFDYSQCFRAEAADPEVARLVAAYQQCGMDVMFQDLTSRFGVPCCKCFVKSQDGTIAKGVGAHLSARRALISAMTETPYPFPKGPPTLQGPDNLVMVPLENLPDYSTGHPETDLAILEEILFENDLSPIYVDLTRKDTGIPVVRAIVPGLEIMADFDEYSRVSPTLFYNYLKVIGNIE